MNKKLWRPLMAFAIISLCWPLSPSNVLAQCVDPPAGMVAWWPLDEQVGAIIVNDILGSHDGTPSPGGQIGNINPLLGPTPASLWPPAGGGKVGDALYFWHQYDNRYVQVPDHPDLQFGTTDFSIDAWVFIIEYSGTDIQPIVEKMQYSGTTPVMGYRFYMESGVLNFQLAWGPGSVTTVYVLPQDQLSQGVWHHVAVTFNRFASPQKVKIYIDGLLVRDVNVGPIGNLFNTSDLIIGGSILGNQINYLRIAIDELEIFNRVLDSLEVKGIYQADSLGKCLPCADCPNNIIQNWSFIDGAVAGQMPSPGATDFWTRAYGTPDVGLGIACCDSVHVAMWGNLYCPTGEALQQGGLTITKGKTYQVSLWVRWPVFPGRPYPPIVRVRASKVSLTTQCDLNGVTIGVTPNVITTHNQCYHFTLPAWTALDNYNFITLSVENLSSYPHGDSTSYAQVDRICIQEVQNHFKTWRIQPLPFDSTVFVQDQFDTADVRLDSIDFLSNPVIKIVQNDTFNIIKPNDHLTWYRAKTIAPIHDKTIKVEYVNQFETTTVFIDTLKYLLVPTQKDPHPAPDSLLGHYTAYKIRYPNPPPRPFPIPVTLQDQFDSIPEYTRRVLPVYFLAPAKKNNEPIFDTLTHYVAYPISGTVLPQTRTTHDQFGAHFMQIQNSQMLLVPTRKDTFVVCTYKPTDCNGDGKLTLADIICLVNVVFKGAPKPVPDCRGDFNCDGKLQLVDIVAKVNFTFKGGPKPLICRECCIEP